MQVIRIMNLIEKYGYPTVKMHTTQEIHFLIGCNVYKIIYKNKKYELHDGENVLKDNLTYKEIKQLLINIFED